jgi:hypothetical protein
LPNFLERSETYDATDIFEDNIGEKILNGFIASGHTVEEKMALRVPG